MDQQHALKSPTQFDSEFCGRVPLNQTNLVQPHGALLVIEPASGRILQCSENSLEFFGLSPEELSATSLGKLVSPGQFERLQLRLNAGLEGKFPWQATIGSRDFLFVADRADGYVLLEAEHVAEQPETFVDIYEQLKWAMAAIEQTATVEEAARLVARELKEFSGFDKVMVYRFDREWNGEVIAEEMEAGMESYLNQYFPASDIPRQARELYRKNPYRLIPNTEYTPIRLYPVLNPLTHSFTDLSNSNLRSVASVHIEYLRNMQVQASMSTRILKNGQLWGLIACHHRTARYLTYQQCSVFELLSTFITSKIGSVENAQADAQRAEALHHMNRLIDAVHDAGSLARGFDKQAEALLRLLGADGAALVQGRTINLWGDTPGAVEIQDLTYWLQTSGVDRLQQYNSLSSVFEPAGNYSATASGLMVLPLQPSRGHYLLAFRSEAIRRINWSGDPNNAIQFEADGKRYHPRHSFQVWQQRVEATAPEWTATDEQAAENFRQFLVEFLLRNLTS